MFDISNQDRFIQAFWRRGAGVGVLELPGLLCSYITFYYYRTLAISLSTRRRGMSATHACSVPRMAITRTCRAHRIETVTPARIFSGRRLGDLGMLRISSTIGRFTKIAIGSCNNVNKLGAISLQDLKTRRATIKCSKVAVDSYRAKRVSVKHFSLSGMSHLSLDGKRDSGVFRPTEFFTSTKVLGVRALAPRFGSGQHAGLDTSFGANS